MSPREPRAESLGLDRSRGPIPYAVRLWASEAFCAKIGKSSYPDDPVPFRKLTQLAADMISEVAVPRAIALFDSYYLCLPVVRACKEKGFRFVGVAKKNRNFFPDGRPHDKRRLSAGRPGDGRTMNIVRCRLAQPHTALVLAEEIPQSGRNRPGGCRV